MMKLKDLQVAVLFGGRSAEHDVSVQSGLLAVESLSKTFRLLPVYQDRSGRFHVPASAFHEPSAALQSARALCATRADGIDAGEALTALRQRGASVVFLALHGPYGEDGRMQGYFEMADLVYTGSGVLGSAMAMNKDVAKRLYVHAGLPVAAWRTLARSEFLARPEVLAEVEAAVGLPLMVKPMELGSSVGMSVCRKAEDLPVLVGKALEHGDSVLLEAYVEGQDLTCAVLEVGPDGACCALPPTLIRPRSSEFFDYEAKYEPGASEEITPAPLPPELLTRIQTLALEAHRVLQLRGYSRTDFMEREGNLVLLETNTLPGLTRTSLLPQAAAVAGIDFDTLLVHLVCVAKGLPSPVQALELRHAWYEVQQKAMGASGRERPERTPAKG